MYFLYMMTCYYDALKIYTFTNDVFRKYCTERICYWEGGGVGVYEGTMPLIVNIILPQHV